jgi:hypothetical protein
VISISLFFDCRINLILFLNKRKKKNDAFQILILGCKSKPVTAPLVLGVVDECDGLISHDCVCKQLCINSCQENFQVRPGKGRVREV